MKLDIVRAWKDQTYRCSLDDAQKIALPSHPVGELADADLATICGGGGFPLGIAASSASSAVSEDIHIHSFSATVCDTDIFSATQLATLSPINVLSHIVQLCANNG